MGKKCVVQGCVNNCSTPNVPVFSFPVQNSLRKDWLQFVNEINGSEVQLRSNSGVCDLHFKPEDYTADLKRKLLNDNAVPSIKASRFDGLSDDQKRNIVLKEKISKLEEVIVKKDTIIANMRTKLWKFDRSYVQKLSDFSREITKLLEENHELKNELDKLAAEKNEREKMKEEELKKLELCRDTEQQRLLLVQAQYKGSL